ncbi:hypothetical protein BLNAU_21862 [Blattamonas nauphoetae]|uniref:Uncharacterized protein n=1 Tax=Blattamonas nauphoetae TaxID=2049346 RepID=A0ABQ9WUP9_9EUKA|nr:hypothetical protein BLNAU_21862 [Blattamonas nauphoetae]
MEILEKVILKSSPKVRLSLVKADLIPQLIPSLNPLSLSFAEAVDIHTSLVAAINNTVWSTSPDGIEEIGIRDGREEQAVQEIVLKQILIPSEKYICHLCMNRFSIIDGDQSGFFLTLLVQLLEISPAYQPTMEFVLNMPVVLTIPSCLTFFQSDESIWYFLIIMFNVQQKWNDRRGNLRQTGTNVLRMLRMEGIDDVIEQKLQNDKEGSWGRDIVTDSIDWNNMQGMNIPKFESKMTRNNENGRFSLKGRKTLWCVPKNHFLHNYRSSV